MVVSKMAEELSDQINPEDVIKKWSHCSNSYDEEKHIIFPVTRNNESNISTTLLRRKLVASSLKGNRKILEVEKAIQDSHKFSLTFTTLRSPSVGNNLHSCKKCQELLDFIDVDLNFVKNGRILSFGSLSKAPKLSIRKKKPCDSVNPTAWLQGCLKWITQSKIASQFDGVFVQTSDKYVLESVRKEDYPILYVHSEKKLLGAILIHIYLTYIDKKAPLTAIQDDWVKSSLIKYFMRKMGFVFYDEKSDNETKRENIEKLLNHLCRGHSIVVSNCAYQFTSTPSFGIFDTLLSAQREKDERLDRTVMASVVLSSEEESMVKSDTLTFKDLVSYLWKRANCKMGFLYLNISKYFRLKSIIKTARDINEQEGVEEENNLIARHINYGFARAILSVQLTCEICYYTCKCATYRTSNLLESSTVLPVHIVSYLLSTKYKHRHFTVEELQIDVENVIIKLQDLSINIGCCGSVENITLHAVRLLCLQGLVTIEKNHFHHALSSILESQILYNQSLKMFHTFMARGILACAIISSCGKEQVFKQIHFHGLPFVGSKVLEHAELIGEMMTYLSDFHCPFNKLLDSLTATVDHFVEMDYIKVQECGFVDNLHQRLANSAQINCALGEEEVLDGRSTEIVYEVSTDASTCEELLQYLSIVRPILELYYMVGTIIRQFFIDKMFSANDVYNVLHEQYKEGFFEHGAMVTEEKICRVFDYFFEMEIIDDRDDHFMVASKYAENSQLSFYLESIVQYL